MSINCGVVALSILLACIEERGRRIESCLHEMTHTAGFSPDLF